MTLTLTPSHPPISEYTRPYHETLTSHVPLWQSPILPGKYHPHPTWTDTLHQREAALRHRHMSVNTQRHCKAGWTTPNQMGSHRHHYRSFTNTLFVLMVQDDTPSATGNSSANTPPSPPLYLMIWLNYLSPSAYASPNPGPNHTA